MCAEVFVKSQAKSHKLGKQLENGRLKANDLMKNKAFKREVTNGSDSE